jgi:hypothetical protein
MIVGIWDFINKNSDLLTKICGGTVAAIATLLTAYTTYVSRPPRVPKTDPGDKAINEAIKQLQARVDNLDSTLKQRMVGVRRILIATWATFLLSMATLGFYSVTANNRLESISRKAGQASDEAGQALQEARKEPKNHSQRPLSESSIRTMRKQTPAKSSTPPKQKDEQLEKPSDDSSTTH